MRFDEELRARLMAGMEAEMDRLLVAAGDRGTVTLTEIERVVGEAGRRIQQQLVECRVREAAQEQGQVRIACPECGGKLHDKGRKGRWVATTSREVKVERRYFYCAACEKGVFPPGSQMGNE